MKLKRYRHPVSKEIFDGFISDYALHIYDNAVKKQVTVTVPKYGLFFMEVSALSQPHSGFRGPPLVDGHYYEPLYNKYWEITVEEIEVNSASLDGSGTETIKSCVYYGAIVDPETGLTGPELKIDISSPLHKRLHYIRKEDNLPWVK